MPIIEVKNLSKIYIGKIKALDNVSFSVNEGEVFGLLGPNGAGKTTLLLILATLIKPTSGSAMVCGRKVFDESEKVRECIGVVFQEPSSDDMLTGYENLQLHALLFGVPRDKIEARIKEALELVDLTGRANERLKHYSGGMRRRLELARGLLHNPKVLLLDEPTLGLDPKTREKMWKYLEALVEKGVTIVITTHYMEEAERLCDRIAIIDLGKVSAIGSVEELKHSVGGDIVKIKGEALSKFNVEHMRSLDYVKSIEVKDSEITITAENVSAHLQEIIENITKIIGKAEHIEIRNPSLNEVFMHYTGREFREKGQEEHEQEEGGYGSRIMRFEKK